METRKKLFEEDLGASSEDISASNFNRDSKNESLSIGDTDKGADQITIKDVKIADIETNGCLGSICARTNTCITLLKLLRTIRCQKNALSSF